MAATDILTARWLLRLAGTIVLAGIVWFFGPLLAPLEGWAPRLAMVLAILLAWLAAGFVAGRRRRRRDREVAEGIVAGNAAEEEAAALRERFTAALRLVGRTRFSRGYLHQRPWYAIIGPPGAGKTTALMNAGLKFPLAGELGHDPLRGVGGTRYCDWWFTDDAVLIDTAGRYTTQDSNTGVDRAGWDAFLDMLKETRSRQP